MKNRYFKSIKIDSKVLLDFVSNHNELLPFIKPDEPFYVRVSKKPYAGLIHTIISQNTVSAHVVREWNELVDFAKKITPKKVGLISLESLTKILGEQKARVISQITADVISKKLNLKLLALQSEETIIDTLKQYELLSLNTIKTFAIFGCFKQNVLCDTDADFIDGLKVFLNKPEITKQDIDNVKIKYAGHLTLFSLTMWKIKNQNLGK